MCLTLRPTDGDKPYDDSNTRWKMLICVNSKHLRSFYKNSHWDIGKQYTAANYGGLGAEPKDIGFHVYVDKRDAIADAAVNGGDFNTEYRYLVAEMEVEGFVASGVWSYDKCETWRKAKVVRLFNEHGENVTAQYEKAASTSTVADGGVPLTTTDKGV